MARRTGVAQQTMHRAVTQLNDEGLLVHTEAGGVPRTTVNDLSASSRHRKDLVEKVMRDMEREPVDRLSAEDVGALRSILARAWTTR